MQPGRRRIPAGPAPGLPTPAVAATQTRLQRRPTVRLQFQGANPPPSLLENPARHGSPMTASKPAQFPASDISQLPPDVRKPALRPAGKRFQNPQPHLRIAGRRQTISRPAQRPESPTIDAPPHLPAHQTKHRAQPLDLLPRRVDSGGTIAVLQPAQGRVEAAPAQAPHAGGDRLGFFKMKRHSHREYKPNLPGFHGWRTGCSAPTMRFGLETAGNRGGGAGPIGRSGRLFCFSSASFRVICRRRHNLFNARILLK